VVASGKSATVVLPFSSALEPRFQDGLSAKPDYLFLVSRTYKTET
jgi:hypothetical protein